MRGWINEQWKDVRDSLWFGPRPQTETVEPRSAKTEFLPKRVLDTASRTKKELSVFLKANGSMPDATSTEDFGAMWSWQSRLNGWFENRVKPGVLSLTEELADHGLTDTTLDNVIHQSDQSEESIALITQRLMLLASRL